MLSMLLAVDFAPIIAPVLEVLNALLWPCIAIVGAVGTIYCIFLGIKIAKSDEQNSREKAKKDLIGAIIGFLVIFILMVALKIAILKDTELAEFIALSKKLDTTGGIAAPREVAFRLTSAIQDDRQLSHFVITGYPLKVPNAWGEELFDLPNTKVVMKLKPVEKSKALKRIDTTIMEVCKEQYARNVGGL